ncbi:phosphotransferase [Herbiconiux moechotypicola]|uniref:S-methyl-5-thioribose kinase n=1 Tax=Herbiconiux moechotypicola TaxID=637393 RepID=A0ABN3E0B4_9MICO|nr:phosphotransferase [Herbiconiux moechotypicola]MCS5731094.1 phosphotransferase [Herbiconiux moechotypicola]
MTVTAQSPYPLLEGRADVVEYLVLRGLLPLVAAATSEVEVREVTAGNMNRVFLAGGPLGSLAVKQAPPWVQVVGPEWPVDPDRIVSEARTYERLAERVPESIPRILDFDAERHVLAMEDLSDLAVLRDVLVAELAAGADADAAVSAGVDAAAGADEAAGVDHVALGQVVGRFVGELAAATRRTTLGDEAHAALVAVSANPELCALTVDVVLDEPYREHEHNRWHPALKERVRELYRDDEVRAAVAGVREAFEGRAEALLHGDLHSGSVMVGRRDGEQAVKVFDPEFSFVGPIGMDLGLFWANLEIAALAADALGRPELAAERYSAVAASLDAFARAWNDPGTLDGIVADAWRFAGVEGMRRAAGFSHAADIETLPEPARAAASVRLFDVARAHILTGAAVRHDFARDAGVSASEPAPRASAADGDDTAPRASGATPTTPTAPSAAPEERP